MAGPGADPEPWADARTSQALAKTLFMKQGGYAVTKQ